MNNLARATVVPQARPSLALRPDMAPRWHAVDMSFDAAAELLVGAHKADGAAEDVVVTDFPTWHVVPERSGHLAIASLRGERAYPLREAAFSELCDLISPENVRNPAGLFRALPAQLQLAGVNYLMITGSARRPVTLRTRGGEVAGIVSDRYTAFDVHELVDTVRSGLAKAGMLSAARVRAVAYGRRRDGMRIVFPSLGREIKRGDVTQSGFTVWSSDMRGSSIQLASTLYRLVCENGLVSEEDGMSYTFRHVGDADKLRIAVANAVDSALTRSSGLMNQWANAVGTMLDDVEAMIAGMQHAYKMTETERDNVEKSLVGEFGVRALPARTSAYDLINAMTDAAKQATPVRRGELEAFAGNVLARHVVA